MKKNKKILIGILIIIGIVLIELLSYKFALLQLNRPESGEGYKTFTNVGETIKVTTSNNVEIKTYVNISYPKLSDEFTFDKSLSSNKQSTYLLTEGENSYTILANYTVGVATNYYDKLVKNNDDSINSKNVNLLAKYGIENNFDVVDYIIKHYDDTVNIFSSSDSIKMRYLINTYANGAVEGTIRYIEGDLEGFLIASNDKTTFEINIKKGNNMYYFSLTNGSSASYFTEESVIEFINSISFN